jgi:aspartate beta-hydroxylase
MDGRSFALTRLARACWERVCQRYPSHELRRIDAFLAIAEGRARPPDAGPGRALHQHLHLPGLTAMPLWEASLFPLAARLAARFALIRQESLALLARQDAFGQEPGVVNVGSATAPSSSLRGVWLGYYLQRYFRRQRQAAAGAPITLRTLDDEPLAREAMLSFLAPGATIGLHSDLVNFVVTIYLPLFSAPGAWIRFGDQVQTWDEGRCFVADSTYYHTSVNHSPWWRGVLIVDVWHPELTPVERAVLEEIVPSFDAVLRGVA